MADDNNLSFSLDLDNSEFVSGMQESLDAVSALGEAEGLKNLLSTFGEVGIAIGAVAAAMFVFKESIDLTVEGEEIQRIQNQFNSLAAQAGINGAALQSAMEKAAGGLIPTNDLLQIANKALVTMGVDAAKLPEIMELARKATLVFGGDLQTNFEAITQAIENGNTRMLKRLGLNIDVTQAEQALATQLGVTTGELSKANQAHAILNAVLAKGAVEFKNVNLEQKRTVDTLTEIKVAFKEMGEALTVAYSNSIGPIISKMASGFKDVATWLKGVTFSVFGNEAQKAEEQAKGLNDQIVNVNKNIAYLKDYLSKSVDPQGIKDATKDLAKQEAELKRLTGTLEQVKAKEGEVGKEGVKASLETSKADELATQRKLLNQQKVKETDTKVNDEIQKLHAATVKLEESQIKSYDDIDKQLQKEKIQRAEALGQVLDKYAKQYGVNSTRYAKLAEAEKAKFLAEEVAAEKNSYAEREKMLKQLQKDTKGFFRGFALESKVAADKAQHDMQDTASIGQQTYDQLTKSGTTAFNTIGAAIASGQSIAQQTAKAMEGYFLNMIADRANAEGALLLASGIGTDNGIAIAEGGALLILGGALKAAAGSLGASGGTSVPSVSSSGASGYSSSYTAAAASSSSSSPAATSTGATASDLTNTVTPQRTVQINIAGHYLNTPQAQRSLMEIMRNETDATGFQYNSIGVR